MVKLNRDIDRNRVESSKDKTIDQVINNIRSKKHHLFPSKRLNLSLVAFGLIIVIVLTLTNFFTPNQHDNYELSNTSVERLAEITYLSSGLISSEQSAYQLMRLSNETETEFESNLNEFNEYFDMLKVFLNEDLYSNEPIITVPIDTSFDYLIEFKVDDYSYNFYLALDNISLSGELHIGDVILLITGELEEENDSLEIKLRAADGSNFVELKYASESKEETEKKYEIQSVINGVENAKEFHFSEEDNETKISINENGNEYELKKEIEDGETKYKLEYNVNNQDGEVTIFEETDNEGAVVYRYEISENGVQKDVIKSKGNNKNRNNSTDSKKDYEFLRI